MKTLKQIRDFDWRAVWISAVALFFLLGVGCTAAWFAQKLRPLELIASAAFLCVAWFMMFRLVVGVKALQSKSLPQGSASQEASGKLERRSRKQTAEPLGSEKPTRRRFLYFDSETGEDVYKMEPCA